MHRADEPANEYDKQLTALFQAYRQALPDREASAAFMPRLWESIEARQTFARNLTRLAQSFVGVAAALCLIMAALLLAPHPRGSSFYSTTYLEALEGDQVVGVNHVESGG